MHTAGNLLEKNRVMGEEIEYAFYAANIVDPEKWLPPGERGVQPDLRQVLYDPLIEKLPRELQQQFDGEIPSRNGFTSFGDVYRESEGGFGEVATGESTSAVELIRRSHEGEAYMHKVGQFLYHILQDEELRGTLQDPLLNASLAPIELIVKRTLGPNGTSCGMHGNYLGERSIDLKPGVAERAYGPVLMSHLVTSLWSFAGGIRKNQQSGFDFVAAAKMCTVEKDYGEETTKDKPLINTRDQPHADASRYRRIHVTPCDGNMWPWPQFMRHTTTSLALRLVENGIDCSDVLLDDPLAAARMCSMVGLGEPDSLDSHIKRLWVFAGGKQMHPLDLQLKLVEKCEKMAQSCYISPEEEYALKEWRRICELMKKDALACDKYVEFIGKLVIGSKALGKRIEANRKVAMDWNSFENAWCTIDPAKSLGIRTREQLESQQAIMQLNLVPYERTRHDARVDALNWGRKHIRNWPVEMWFWWERLTTYETVEQLDPYNDDPQPWLSLLERTLAKMSAT